jgi:hypothetical protein
MITNHLKKEVQPTPETSCITNIPQAMDSVQHGVPVNDIFFTFVVCMHEGCWYKI